MNPSTRPPRTSRIGYGMRSVGASAISAATAARRPSRTSWAWLPNTLLEYEPMCEICQDRGLEARVNELPPFGLGYPGTELRRQLVAAVLASEKTATAGLAEGDEAP